MTYNAFIKGLLLVILGASLVVNVIAVKAFKTSQIKLVSCERTREAFEGVAKRQNEAIDKVIDHFRTGDLKFKERKK